MFTSKLWMSLVSSCVLIDDYKHHVIIVTNLEDFRVIEFQLMTGPMVPYPK